MEYEVTLEELNRKRAERDEVDMSLTVRACCGLKLRVAGQKLRAAGWYAD